MSLRRCYIICLAAEIHGGHQESITSVTCRISSCTGSRPYPLLPVPAPTPALLPPYQILRVLGSGEVQDVTRDA